MSFSEKQIQLLKRRQKEMGRRALKRQIVKMRYPHSVERNYQRRLTQYVDILEEAFNDIFENQLHLLVTKAEAENRIDDFSRDLDNLINATKGLFTRRRPEPETLAREAANEIDQASDQEIKRITETALGVSILAPKPFIESQQGAFVRQNVTLINKISDDLLDQMEIVIARSLQQGEDLTSVQQEISQRFEITRRRANNIATNEVTTYNGILNSLKQRSAGITRFTWSTSLDERVRPSHAAKEGKVFEWNNPPSDTGAPGSDVNCRCVGIPVLEDLIEDLL